MKKTSSTPSASTYAGIGIGVPVATVFAWLMNTFLAVEVPGEVQAAIGALIGTLAGYFFLGGKNEDVE